MKALTQTIAALGLASIASAHVLAGSFASVRREQVVQTQEPRPFDPVFPAHERWASMPHVEGAAALAAVTDDAPGLFVPLRDLTDGSALARFSCLRQLSVATKDSPKTIPVATLRAIAALPSLEYLCLPFEVPASSLRELRAAPKLTTLVLWHRSLVFDANLATALMELRRLSHLWLGVEWTPTGIEALAGLRHLEILDLVGNVDVPPATIARLRTLRVLSLSGYSAVAARRTFTAAQMQQIATLPRLASLALDNLTIDDQALAALPRSLQSLELTDVGGIDPESLSALAELPHLRALLLRCTPNSAAMRAAESDLVRALPLERFGGHLEANRVLWELLAEKPKLRALTVYQEKGDLDLEPCTQLRALEQLTLDGPKTVTPAMVAPLKEHPTLEQLVIARWRHTPEQVLELGRRLGPRIELRIQ